MTYRPIHFEWSESYVAEIISPTGGTIDWRTVALPLRDALVSPAIDVQEERWALAQTLGLFHYDQSNDLPSNDMMIDRTLLAMLKADGVDVPRIGRKGEPAEEPVGGDELKLTRSAPNSAIRCSFGRWDQWYP